VTTLQLSSKIAVVAALSLGAIMLAALTIMQTPNFNTRTIQVEYVGYKDFKELAESAKVIVTGTVESIKSTSNASAQIPSTTFEVKIERISKLSPDGGMGTVMVQQFGSKSGRFTVEEADNPLMKMGDEYVFFLVGGEDNGWQVPYGTTGPYGKFQVISGTIYPLSQSWSRYQGMSLYQFLGEVDSALGVKTTYSSLWEAKPEIVNQTEWKILPPSEYPAPVWLLETWIGKIGLHWDELSKKGVILWSCGRVGNGKLLVSMDVVSNETVSTFMETIQGEVPPGILMIAKGSPAIAV